MTATPIQSLTLGAFLKLPYIEESPAWEYMPAWEYTPTGEDTGQARQKPMPQTQHSRLQFKLCEAINQISEEQEIACAFPEFCTRSDRLPVLAGIELETSPTQIFDWLKMKRIATH